MKIFIADAAIELSPKSWLKDERIQRYYSNTGRFMLRNASKHQHLLREIPKELRYDRPDILHLGLITVLGYSRIIDNMKIYFSCQRGLFEVKPGTNIPRSQERFYGILESLLSSDYKGKFINQSTDDMISSPAKKVVFSSKGMDFDPKIAKEAEIFVFGGFAVGDYKTIMKSPTTIMSLSPAKLELWTALSVFLNKYMNFIS
ncbi:MAG: hypothetical protein ACXAD7_16720 [Candidatus Kariarchaeaceae archaeon]